MLKTDYDIIIERYNNGESLNELARAFGTYPTSITRILKKHNVPLRHDVMKKGEFYVKDGEKLIEWAKAQGRLVTKSELAAVVSRKKLSHSYFEKYPELGQYVSNYNNADLDEYINKIANFLTENNISYKPNDRTKLGVSVDFLLLGEYSNIALQLNEKPYNMSTKRHNAEMSLKATRADEKGVYLLFLSKENLETEEDLKVLRRTLIEVKDTIKS